MFTIALCDDEDFYLDKYENIISKYFSKTNKVYEIVKFKTGDSLLLALEDDPKRFEIFILDVVMPRMSGFELASKINELIENANIIFLTTSREFVFDAFEYRPINYLIKTDDDNKISQTLEKVLEKQQKLISNDNFIYSSKTSYLNIPNASITYFEVLHRVITVHRYNMPNDEFYCSFKDLEKIIDDKKFIKIYRSYIVNMQYIYRVFNYQVELKDGTILPISRNLYEVVKKKLSNYLNQSI